MLYTADFMLKKGCAKAARLKAEIVEEHNGGHRYEFRDSSALIEAEYGGLYYGIHAVRMSEATASLSKTYGRGERPIRFCLIHLGGSLDGLQRLPAIDANGHDKIYWLD